VFVAGGDELEEQIRGVLLEREVADLVDDDQPVAAQLDELLWEPACAVGVGEAVTQSVAVANRTRRSGLAAATPRAVARWVLPVPGGPRRTTLRASVRNPPDASAAICWRAAGWASKSKPSRTFIVNALAATNVYGPRSRAVRGSRGPTRQGPWPSR
jgi:hypothetical protein